MNKYHSGYFLKLDKKKFSPKKYSKEMITDPKLALIPSNYAGQGWQIEWFYDDHWNGLEFIIKTNSFEVAQNVLYNVLCSASVINGPMIFGSEPHYPHDFGTLHKTKGYDLVFKPVRIFSDLAIPSYFYLASLASKDIRLANSIVKYQLSTEIYSQDDMDLFDVVNWKTTNYNFIQMRFAYAIITAYSVIEELGLEVNVSASKNKRSILDNGEWNPEVLNDLINRLKLSNINIEENIAWMIRGVDTKIEKKRPIKTTRIAEWADLEDYADNYFIKIKDGYVYLPDAINYISFLRSSISSHYVGERIMNLSVFDVGNAQHLAKRLILEKTKLWK